MTNGMQGTISKLIIRAKIASSAHPQVQATSQPLSVSFRCKTCSDLQFLRDDECPVGHPAFGRLTACPDCNKRGVTAECGLNEKERTLRLMHVVTDGRPGAEQMLTAARDFMQRKTGMLSLHGRWGNGKTLILQAIVNECREAGIEARYITATELVLWLMEAFDEKIMDTDKARIERLANIPILCIDELDKARDKPYSREMQQYLIDRRYRNGHLLGTLFAWNGSFTALGMPAVSSRLSEYIVVENNDDDIRLLLGAQRKKRMEAQHVSAG